GVVNAIIKGSASTSSSGSVGAGTGAGTNAGASGNVSTEANVGVDLPILVVTRADVESGTAQAGSAAVASVQTDADLSGFVAAQIESDKNVSKVETSADSVSVTYTQNAKLLGFIPI